MSIKKVFYLFLLILLLGFSNVQSGDTSTESNNNQYFHSQKIEQSEQEKIDNGQRELSKILKNLEDSRKRIQSLREEEPLPVDWMSKEKNRKEQIQLDKLELSIREKIDQVLEKFESRQPLNKELSRQIVMLNIDLQEILLVIKRIEERRAPELRAQELRRIQYIRQQINERNEIEKKQTIIEDPVKNQYDREQRVKQLETLKNHEKNLLDSLQRWEDWHKTNSPMNNAHTLILFGVKQSFDSYTSFTNSIDKGRLEERRAHLQQVTKVKEELNAHKLYELEQRKLDVPLKNEASYLQRKNDEFIEDCLDQGIRLLITNIEKHFAENKPLDKDYANERESLLKQWQQLIAHVKVVHQRRTQEQNLYKQDKSGQKQSQNHFVQQQQLTHLGGIEQTHSNNRQKNIKN